MSIFKAKKKPVIVECMKYNGAEDIEVAQNWLRNNFKIKNYNLYIVTLEGDMLISPGDYIIKGVNGEFYPCKSDIFEKTYDVMQL